MPEPKATKSTVSLHEPADGPHLFEQRLNAGDLDEVMTLYESEVRFVERSGETLVGHDRIREVLGGMTAARKRDYIVGSSSRSPSATSLSYPPTSRER
jgi:hypothetical protein